MTLGSPEDKSFAILKAEHRTIERVLRVLETLMLRWRTGEGFELEALRQCVEFFRLFADAYHFGKEEGLLFPVLEARGIARSGGPIGVMLMEHRQARELTRRMGECIHDVAEGREEARELFYTTAAHYLSLLTNHIHKEDNILFSLGERALSDDDERMLTNKFCEAACQLFDGRRREDLERMASDLEQRWG